MRHRMDKALMKTIRRRELAPVTHWVTNVPAAPAPRRRNNAIALHAESIRPGTLVLLFGVDIEIASWCGLRGQANRNGCRHQAAVAISDRKSTRLNSSHITISYAVFCLKKKKKK